MTARRRPLPALPERRDDAGMAMLHVVLVLLVATAMSMAMLATVTSEVVPTAHERVRGRALVAARAGLEAGLSVLRSARTTVPGVGELGDVTRLPCAGPQAPLTGTVPTGAIGAAGGAAGDLLTYSVVVRYYVDSPAGRSAAWRAANALECRAGSGPAEVPTYALLESAARSLAGSALPAGWGDRSVESVYLFNRTDEGLLGGVIRTGRYQASTNLCWEAAAARPADGSPVRLADCDDTSALQSFAYRDDYSIVLAGTQSAAEGATDGMCVTTEPTGRSDLADGTGRGNDARPVPASGVRPELVGPVQGSATRLSDGAWLQTRSNVGAHGFATLSAWFRTSVPGGTIIASGGSVGASGDTPDHAVWVDDAGRLVYGLDPVARHTVISPGSYADGRWHHVVASNQDGAKLYVDGVLVATDPGASTGGGSDGYWHLGWGGQSLAGWPAAPSDPFFTGSLAHVAAWTDRQLGDAEVTAIATASTWAQSRAAVLAAAPSAYWPLGGSHDVLDLFLATCDGGAHQKWAYNDGGRLEAARFDLTGLSQRCVHAPTRTAGAVLTVLGDCGSRTDWTPAPQVGAGPAGEVTEQLINYGEYGRCLDVTNQNVNWPFLIAYPCKSDPTGAVKWNQRFRYDEATRQVITEPTNSGPHCLTAPAAIDGYVLVKPCSADPLQRWTVSGNTGSRATSWTFVDAEGRCLGLGTPGEAGGGLSQWSSIRSQNCDGGYEQKWNAPPQIAGADVQNERETTLG